jgi:glycosyltransferase involved in cell wall biosynthesis
MRILMPSIVDPWTHAGGAAAATRGLLALLAGPAFTATVDVVVPGSRLPHSLRQLTALARSVGSRLPSKALFMDTRMARTRLRALAAAHRYDLVLVNGGDLLGLRPLLPRGVPTVLYAHNLERDLFAAQIERSHVRGPAARFLARDLAKLAAYEHAGMRAVGGVLCISATDSARLAAQVPGLRTLHLPPLFDYEPQPARARARPTRPLRLGFLANFDWWPNRLGLEWLLADVLPHVPRNDLRLELFGAGSTRYARADRRIVAHGFVADVARVFAACDVMVCPIHTGAGVNVKFAEALYNGVPVLGTRFASRGLPPTNGRGIRLADEAAEWVAMLSGETITTLAGEPPSLDTARAFAPATHASALRAFVDEVAAQSRGGYRSATIRHESS